MEMNRRDAFRPFSKDSSGDKSQFYFISPPKKKKKLIGIDSPNRF